MKKVKKGLDCVAMKHSIQEQLAKEMKGMSAKERLRYIKQQVQQSPFAGEIRRSETVVRKAGNY
jgi:type III secretory pathway component EscU